MNKETLMKHISCNCKCKFNGKNVIQIKSRIDIDMSVKIQ